MHTPSLPARRAALRATCAIVLGALFVTACLTRQQPSPTPSIVPSAPPLYTAPNAAEPALTSPTTAVFTFTTDFAAYTLNGSIYNAAWGPKQGLPHASMSWRFVSAELQTFNGQTAANSTGEYELGLRLRPQDQIILTASAPGYLPTTVQLHGAEIAQYGSRLDFGLVKANSPWPAVPGDVGPFQLNGFVYDADRGQVSPIAKAEVQIHTISIVHPPSIFNLITDSFGEFSATLTLHSTDQVNIIAEATGYYSTTLIRSTDAVSSSVVLVALVPIR